jgi:hypothetical protein
VADPAHQLQNPLPPRLTAFALPKAFVGHAAVIQENAIRGWAALGLPIILMGKDAGVAEMAAAVGARHLPDVATNELGTPRLDSAFAIAAERATTPLIMYVNSDILFVDDPAAGAAKVGLAEFLGVGRRTNVDVGAKLVFSDDWRERARAMARERGELSHRSAIDYFILPRRSALTKLPPFVVGRPGWDNWMLATALERAISLVDMTDALLAVHQNHDYGHIQRGASGGEGWAGPEADTNRRIAAGKYRDIGDCTHALRADGRLIVDHWNKGRMHWRRARAGAGAGEVTRAIAHLLRPAVWPRLLRRAVAPPE